MAKKGTQHPAFWLVLIQWVLAFQWIHSGWGKFQGSTFMNSAASTLNSYAGKTSFTFYADFLRSTVAPNAWLVANFVRFGELAVGFSMLVGGIALLWYPKFRRYVLFWLAVTMSAAALINLNYFWAASDAHPSVWGMNAVMGLSQGVIAAYYIIETAKTENSLILKAAKTRVVTSGRRLAQIKKRKT